MRAICLTTRFAGLPRRRAVAYLALLLVALVACALAAPSSGAEDTLTDATLNQTIVESVSHGGTYYAVLAEALRQQGTTPPPLLAVPLPTLTMVEAHLPPLLITLLLYALVAATLYAWHHRIRAVLPHRRFRFAALVLLAVGMAAFAQPVLLAVPELWAGLLVALALALWRTDRWIEPVALGLAAMLLAEAAALFALVMAVAAALERSRRETIAWLAALALFAVTLGTHLHALASFGHLLGIATPAPAAGHGVVAIVISPTLLAPFPPAIGAVALALSLFGWAAWHSPTGLRAVAMLLIYAALLAVAGRIDTFDWGLLVAPLSLLGLVFAPAGVRDLVVAARRRRRITVTRKAV